MRPGPRYYEILDRTLTVRSIVRLEPHQHAWPEHLIVRTLTAQHPDAWTARPAGCTGLTVTVHVGRACPIHSTTA